MTLQPWAKAQAERLIAPLGDRWAHVQAVADKARRVAAVLPAEDADLLVAAAFLYDIGYAPSLDRLGFHPVDGARFLRAYGQERLACLVAHHSGARFEAEERGLVEELAAFPVEDGPVLDALTFADMTTGPAGQPMTLDERIGEIQRRYSPDDPVHRAILRARPLLRAACSLTPCPSRLEMYERPRSVMPRCRHERHGLGVKRHRAGAVAEQAAQTTTLSWA